MDYRELDNVGQELFRLYPDEYGLTPQDAETYIALAVRDYFTVLEQRQRIDVIRRLVIPQQIGIIVDTDANAVDFRLTEADINKGLLGLITLYAVKMALQEFDAQMERLLEGGVEGADGRLAARLRAVTAGALRKAYESFEPERMSKNLEEYLKRLYLIVISGEDE